MIAWKKWKKGRTLKRMNILSKPKKIKNQRPQCVKLGDGENVVCLFFLMHKNANQVKRSIAMKLTK